MSPEETEADLRAAIEASPHDEAARRVYADWLLEREDPRGELVLVQLERHREPLRRRMTEDREARLFRRLPALSRDATWLFDRGEQGLDIELARFDELERLAPRWLRVAWPVHREPPGFSTVTMLETLRDHPVFAEVYRLDLSRWTPQDPWEILLTSRARPRHFVVPSGAPFDQLVDAPLLSELAHLDLGGGGDDAAIARLVRAPWAQRLTEITCQPGPITDDGLALLARLPRLARLDIRGNPITAAGIERLAQLGPPLVRLRVTLDTLGVAGIAALARSRYAGVAQVSLARPSIEAVLALVRSPCWDGTLDLHHYADDARALDVLRALARVTPARPLVAIRTGTLRSGFDTFIHSPVARTLRHLDADSPGHLDDVLHLSSLRIGACHVETLAQITRSPATANLDALTLHGIEARHVRVLAASHSRPRVLVIEGSGSTDATSALARSPVLERVTHLTLAMHGNHAANVVTAAFAETPYLQDVQRIELDFAGRFPAAKRARLQHRFGAALGAL